MNDVDPDEILPEYDFSQAKQGKYAVHIPHGVTAALLDDDVAKVFPDGRQINEILRALIPVLTK